MRNKKNIKSKQTKLLLLNLIILISLPIGTICSDNIKAPNFIVYDINGKRNIFYNILNMLTENRILILNFTSVYCAPCRMEIPELLGISKNEVDRVKLIFIYAEIGKPVKKNASLFGIQNMAYVDPFGKIRRLFSVKKFPITILINRKRKLLARFEGYSKENISTIKEIIKK
jgi:thiol-disulfide isomerase/thioredoxin